MKKLLVLLALTALVFALLAACDSKYTAPLTETTTAVAEVQPTTEVKEEETLPNPPEKVEQTEKKKVENNKPEEQVKKTEKQTNAEVKVTKDEAKKAVLAHAGLNEADIKFYKVELDRERAGLVYEIEFDAGKYEYEYEVDSENGKVLKAEKEFRD